MSETSKYRHLTVTHCGGNGIDIGSGGDPVVPWAISIDLPSEDYHRYNAGTRPENAIHLNCDARILPFKDKTLDFVYSSHLLEDFHDWKPVLQEWGRVLKPGGFIVILVPDRERWRAAVDAGQPPNCAHRHEGSVGELSRYFKGWNVIRDSLTNLSDTDYSILFIATKPVTV
jgi:SAM-dependent methyltransferase